MGKHFWGGESKFGVNYISKLHLRHPPLGKFQNIIY